MTQRKKTETFQIVIAWTVTEHVYDGRPYARDLGARPGMRQVRVGKACMWLNRGTTDDLKKAKAYAAVENAMVFCYPPSERAPLARARREAVEQAP